MDGIFFYWFSWMFWLYCTFIMEKGKRRTRLSLTILFLIISVQYSITFLGFSFHLAFITCLFIGYGLIGTFQRTQKLFVFIVCLMCTLLYVSFHLFGIYDPVIIMFHQSWMIGMMIALLVIALIKKNSVRLATVLIGTGHGDLILSLVMKDMFVNMNIGSLLYFDILSIAILLITCWSVLEYVVKRLELYVNRYNENVSRLKDFSG
ncbi:YphA family membrane protein [Bacillus sp. FJAT-45350]|uniref:YphA family membrane protein n=1 Tax=Bacillus sp. FJAT-45350 TaxID=2011014 RepID=UPI000BB8A93F|nr:hypothetical protein [Bacillus sp. FJAT-45350]